MPFGLKNARAACKRMTTTLLHSMVYKEVEIYVDHMIVKSRIEKGTTTHSQIL